MHGWMVLIASCLASCAVAATVKVDVNVMPRVVFTGDSQTCGCVGAWDYAQMLSWELPMRVINTAVGGSNTVHLVSDFAGGVVVVKKGEREIKGTDVSWFAGPYPGQKIRVGGHEYVIDRMVTHDYVKRICSIWLTEAAVEDYSGTEYKIEQGWRVRIAERKPIYVVFMYSVNDVGWTREVFRARLEEITKRTREIGAQPIFLSGVPLMDPGKGGSHPGWNPKVDVRASEMAAFCRERGVPFGDVFHTLMTLDEQATSVWVDTVHPTSDGSWPAIEALRRIFAELGASANPYFVRPYRANEGLAKLGGNGSRSGERSHGVSTELLVPFTTSQPRYNAANVDNGNEFDLAAIKARDEYGLIAAADGDAAESATPVVLQFGVGARGALTGATAEVVARPAAAVSVYDWEARTWQPLATGEGRITGKLTAEMIAKAWHEGCVWLAVEAKGKLALDYAALTLEGDVAPFEAKPRAGEGVWPAAGELAWADEATNLARNGSFAKADGAVPEGWQQRGAQATCIHSGAVAEGVGEFGAEKSLFRFKSAGSRFTQTVRPLDSIVIAEGPEGATGRFLVRTVVSDEVLEARRAAKAPASGLSFKVVRGSGCLAVPGECCVECRGGSFWQTVLPGMKAGRYRLGFFHRAYDPASMKAKGGPGKVAKVEVSLGPNATLATAEDMEGSYTWRRSWVEFTLPGEGEVQIRLGARGETAVEYTGVRVERE